MCSCRVFITVQMYPCINVNVFAKEMFEDTFQVAEVLSKNVNVEIAGITTGDRPEAGLAMRVSSLQESIYSSM